MSFRIRNIMLGMVFFLSPLAFYTRAAEGFTLTKELLAAAGLAYVLGSFPASAWKGVLRSGLIRALLSFAAWMLLASFFTATVKAEVFRGAIHTLLPAGVLLAAVLAGRERPGCYDRLLRLSLFSGIGVALFGILQWLQLDKVLNWTTRFEGRVFSTMGNPNYLGGHLAALLPAAFLLALSAERKRSRILWSLGAGALFITLLAARTRGAYLASAASFAVVGILLLTPWGMPVSRRNKGFLLGAYGLAFLLMLTLVMRMGGLSIFSMQGDTVRQRMDTWKAAGLMVREHPVLGVGIEQLKVLYPSYQHRSARPDQYRDHPYTYTEHVHNEFLRFHLEGGLVGLSLFLAVLVSFARGWVRCMRSPLLSGHERALLISSAGGVTAVLVQSLSNFPLQIAPTALVFSLYLAFPLVQAGREGIPPLVPQRGLFLPLALSGLVLLAGFRAVSASVAYRNLTGETQLGNYRLAMEYGRRLLSVDPWNYKGYFAYGKALEGLQLYASAVEAYQRTYGINPYHVESMTAEAAVDMQQGRNVEAFLLCDKAVAIAPNFSGPQFIRGAMLFQMGRYPEAASAFRRVLGMIPQHFESWSNLGTSLVKAGDRQGAIAAWLEAQRLNPNDEAVRAYLKANGVP